MRISTFVKSLLVSLLTTALIIGTTAPAQSLDLGPSSSYLVRVTPEAKAAIEKTLGQYGAKIDKRYQYVFDGFLVKLPDMAVVALKKIPNILIIEKDDAVDMSAIQNSPKLTSMSIMAGRVYLLPIALGTCGIRFDFAGIPGWKVVASSNTWVATVNK